MTQDKAHPTPAVAVPSTRDLLIEALDHYLRQDETAGDIDNGVYRRGQRAMSAALSEDFAPPSLPAAQAVEGVEAVREKALEEAALACDCLRDDAKEDQALINFNRAIKEGPENDAVKRGEFWLTVSTFNAGLKRAAASIRALAGGAAK